MFWSPSFTWGQISQLPPSLQVQLSLKGKGGIQVFPVTKLGQVISHMQQHNYAKIKHRVGGRGVGAWFRTRESGSTNWGPSFDWPTGLMGLAGCASALESFPNLSPIFDVKLSWQDKYLTYRNFPGYTSQSADGLENRIYILTIQMHYNRTIFSRKFLY